VALIDRKYIGGSCPNIACLPSKNIIHSARVASLADLSRKSAFMFYIFCTKGGFYVSKSQRGKACRAKRRP